MRTLILLFLAISAFGCSSTSVRGPASEAQLKDVFFPGDVLEVTKEVTWRGPDLRDPTREIVVIKLKDSSDRCELKLRTALQPTGYLTAERGSRFVVTEARHNTFSLASTTDSERKPVVDVVCVKRYAYAMDGLYTRTEIMRVLESNFALQHMQEPQRQQF